MKYTKLLILLFLTCFSHIFYAQKSRKRNSNGPASARPKKRKRIERQVDIITSEDITNVPQNQKITLAGKTYLKSTIMNHILSQIGAHDLREISDPFRNRIGVEIIQSLARYFNIPLEEIAQPTLDTDLQKIPSGLSEQTYLQMKSGNPNNAIWAFKQMIRSDTLRALARRLQEADNTLQMYPEGSRYWEDGNGDRQLLEREAQITRQALKTRLESFGYKQ